MRSIAAASAITRPGEVLRAPSSHDAGSEVADAVPAQLLRPVESVVRLLQDSGGWPHDGGVHPGQPGTDREDGQRVRRMGQAEMLDATPDPLHGDSGQGDRLLGIQAEELVTTVPVDSVAGTGLTLELGGNGL